MMRSIELFAGAGGLGIGLHQAGFRPVSVIELNAYCCDTIRENQERGITTVENWPVAHCDVRTVDFNQFEGCVLIATEK
ncbi:DNA cytosine methyltransferase [Sphingobium sp.]|uniref:DNA cytosine methyltransferase n=1 Tax=Sphingobium sp. TaxID=1912891 RepID=UPI0039C964F0